KTRVSIFDPMVMTWIMENDQMKPIATEVQEKLQRVLKAI
ncbi:MAG: ABC transporter ATP-binding protein, partial [Ignavibacteriaceae bacterium]|nr:ABC transporter ATP-binding protein [Ignavibacteriaceae bacterium]